MLAALALVAANITVPFTSFTLDNGMMVVVHEDHTIPRVNVTLRYRTGSARETPGRTGFAHLFEHLMFEGSKHVPEGAFDRWLEAAGGDNNAYTSEDYTVYFESVPSNALELPLFLESDRMAYFAEQLSPGLVDGQRDVVKNERRQSYENRPYGKAWLHLPALLYPPNHPYAWPVIGSMEDLSAASVDDVKGFFTRWYTPANAVLVVAGDVSPARAKALVEKWFADVPARAAPPPPDPRPAVRLPGEKRVLLEDDVGLAKLILAWPTVGVLDPSDAALDVVAGVLATGKNSRLYQRLVYDLQVAQDVEAYQESMDEAGAFYVEVTARPGRSLQEVLKLVEAELEKVQQRVEPREVERTVNGVEAQFLDGLEALGSKADRLGFFAFTA
jgi:zinc protease